MRAVPWRIEDSGRDVNLTRGRFAGGDASVSSSGRENSEGRHESTAISHVAFFLRPAQASRGRHPRLILTDAGLRGQTADPVASVGGGARIIGTTAAVKSVDFDYS